VPDLRGVAVDDVNERPAGAVYGALADAPSGLIRYLDVALHSGDRHVLVPVGHTRFLEELSGLRIKLRAAAREELARIPEYPPQDGGPDDDYHDHVLEAHGRLFYGERYYAHPAFDHGGIYAGAHPIVPPGDAAGSETGDAGDGLVRLSRLSGWELAPGAPEVRGRPLLAADGLDAGCITDLVVEPRAGRAHYAVLDRPEQGPTLLPVGYLQVSGDTVRAPALATGDIAGLPLLADAPPREAEEELRAALARCLRGERRFLRPDFRQPGGG
jgi:hypothetical protein